MKYLIINKHWDITKDYNLDKLLYLLVDKPDIIHNDFIIWTNNKYQTHRNYDLPSHSSSTGFLYWYKNGKLHRENNKPAVIWYNDIKEHWIEGEFIKKETR